MAKASFSSSDWLDLVRHILEPVVRITRTLFLGLLAFVAREIENERSADAQITEGNNEQIE